MMSSASHRGCPNEKGSKVCEGGDSDRDSCMPQGLPNPLRHTRFHLLLIVASPMLLLKVVPTPKNDKHVIHTQTLDQQGQEIVHGAVGKPNQGTQADGGQHTHCNRQQTRT